jgi:hypothetical protein
MTDPTNKNVSVPGDDRSPAFTWVGYLYSDGESVAIPSDNLAACLRQAGARVKLGGRKTLKEGAVSGLWIEQDHLPLTVGGKPVPMAPIERLKGETDFTAHLAAARKMGFVLFAKRARITAKSKHVRVRPKFDTWAVAGSLEVDAPEITKDVLDMLFFQAGRIGLGDWRPGCATPGRYGMFDATVKTLK